MGESLNKGFSGYGSGKALIRGCGVMAVVKGAGSQNNAYKKSSIGDKFNKCIILENTKYILKKIKKGELKNSSPSDYFFRLALSKKTTKKSKKIRASILEYYRQNFFN